MVENAQKFDQFMISKLAEELKELRDDRKNYQENIQKLEKFVIGTLAEEIQEFEQDKRAVVEARVRLVAEAKEKLANLQSQFVQRSAKLVKEAIASNLQTEITQLKEDIQVARENMFGRRLFEAFASEFAVTHLNENREIVKLRQVIAAQETQLNEAQVQAEQAQALAESKEKEVKIIKESADRRETLGALLKSLNKEKAAVMSELLENVQTAKLQSAFEKYLPAVLNNNPVKPAAKVALTESRFEITGDKAAKVSAQIEDVNNVIEIKRLAGLK
jgi:predicted DNA-binding protein